MKKRLMSALLLIVLTLYGPFTVFAGEDDVPLPTDERPK